MGIQKHKKLVIFHENGQFSGENGSISVDLVRKRGYLWLPEKGHFSNPYLQTGT